MVRHCRETTLTKKSGTAGSVLVTFIISPQGDVKTATVKEDTLGDEALARCLTQLVKQLVFPRRANTSAANVSYPFTFTSEGWLPAGQQEMK